MLALAEAWRTRELPEGRWFALRVAGWICVVAVATAITKWRHSADRGQSR